MKVNELSRLTGVGIETIRKYRNQGLLFPDQKENGYYDYSEQDLIRLLYIRKMRGSGLGLDSIEYTYYHDDRKEIYRILTEEANLLDAQIAQLQQRRKLLDFTLQHFQEGVFENNTVTEIQMPLPAYALPLSEAVRDAAGIQWLHNIQLLTQIMILDTKKYQFGKLPQWIPYTNGIGSYAYILESNGIPVARNAVRLAPGKYLAIWLEPERTDCISRRQIEPLFAYAAAHGLRFTGLCTGFVYRVNQEQNFSRFAYRFLANVESER